MSAVVAARHTAERDKTQVLRAIISQVIVGATSITVVRPVLRRSLTKAAAVTAGGYAPLFLLRYHQKRPACRRPYLPAGVAEALAVPAL